MYRECHSRGLNSHSCDYASWPRILRKGWSRHVFFHILLSDVNVCIVNGQQLKLNTVSGQSSENQCGYQSNAEKSWSKSWPTCSCGHTCDYGVYGSDTPLMYIREYPDIPIQYSHVIKRSSLISANSLLGTGLISVPATLPETLPFLDHTEWKKAKWIALPTRNVAPIKEHLIIGSIFSFCGDIIGACAYYGEVLLA